MIKIGDKVLFNGAEYKITQELMGVYWGRKKYARADEELPLDKIEPIQLKTQNSTSLVSKEEKGAILRALVESATLKDNFIRELVLLNKMIKKFPSREFWLEVFKPALKVESLVYWLHRQEVENLYKVATLDLTVKQEPVKLEESKIGNDLNIKKKPKNLLELLK